MIAQSSDNLALAFKNSLITYRELHENIAGFSSAFSLAPGQRAIIFSENRPKWLNSLYGLWLHQGMTGMVLIMRDYISSCKIKYEGLLYHWWNSFIIPQLDFHSIDRRLPHDH